MARPRKRGDKDLPEGLYRDPRYGTFYIRHPATGKKVSLQTKDAKTARGIHAQYYPQWKHAQVQDQADEMLAKLEKGSGPTIADFARQYREEQLPQAVGRGGKLLGEKTRKDYGEILANHVEQSEVFQELGLAAADNRYDEVVKALRQYLNHWTGKPSFYNYQLALLSRLFAFAVDSGQINRNPVKEIARRPTKGRDTYIPDEDLVAITSRMEEHWARAIDLYYMLSSRPSDALALQPSRDIEWEGEWDPEARRYRPVIRFITAKTDQPLELVANDDLEELIRWWMAWKKRQGLATPYLMCYPRKSRSRGKPFSVKQLSRQFRAAAVAAGFPDGFYQLRDVRPKSLTDEWRVDAGSNKGGHKTDEMRRHYMRVMLPVRERTNVRRIQGDDAG